MQWLARLAGVLIAPRQTFRDLIHHGQGGIGDVLGLMFLAMLGTAPLQTAAALVLVQRGVLPMLSALVGQFIQFALLPLVVTLALGLVLGGVQRLRAGNASIDGLMTAAVYAWVPVGVLGMLGALLAEIGWQLTVLPHVPLAAFLQSEPAWWQLLLHLVLSYGWSAWLVWILVQVTKKGVSEQAGPTPRPLWPGWLLVAGLAISWIGGGIFAAVHFDRIRPVLPGDRAAAFRLPRVDGQGWLALSDLHGKPVIVEFWAEWCSACVSHMPTLNSWAAAHPEVPVLAIHQGAGVESVRRFLSGKGWSHLVFLVDRDHSATKAYRVDTLPAFFVIDPLGRVRAVRVGPPADGWLDHQLEHLDRGQAVHDEHS